jgi:phosphoglycerate dehydrogenase-like enzyme
MHFVCPDGDPQYRDTIEAAVAPLLDAGHTFTWYDGIPTSVDEWRDRCQAAGGMLLLLHLPGEAMRALEHLRVVSWAGTGVGRYVDVPLATQLGLTVCNVPSYGANAIAEHALGLMLAAARGIGRGDRLIRAGGWAQHGGRELRGAQLGVVGVGPIGRRMLEIGQALGMVTVAWTNKPSPDRAQELSTTFMGLHELMRTSDFVSVHVAHTDETEGLLSRKMLALLPPHAVLVNTARGEVLDQQALIELLESGRLAGAGLDVFSPEPPAPGDSVLACERAVLTPHIAYDTPSSTAELFRRAADNLLLFAQGTPANVVGVEAAE